MKIFDDTFVSDVKEVTGTCVGYGAWTASKLAQFVASGPEQLVTAWARTWSMPSWGVPSFWKVDTTGIASKLVPEPISMKETISELKEVIGKMQVMVDASKKAAETGAAVGRVVGTTSVNAAKVVGETSVKVGKSIGGAIWGAAKSTAGYVSEQTRLAQDTEEYIAAMAKERLYPTYHEARQFVTIPNWRVVHQEAMKQLEWCKLRLDQRLGRILKIGVACVAGYFLSDGATGVDCFERGLTGCFTKHQSLCHVVGSASLYMSSCHKNYPYHLICTRTRWQPPKETKLLDQYKLLF